MLIKINLLITLGLQIIEFLAKFKRFQIKIKHNIKEDFNQFKSQKIIQILKPIMNLIKEDPFFKTLSNNYRILSQISNKIQYQKFKQNEIIYNAKQIADKFYILLSGTIHLTVVQWIQTTQDKNILESKQDHYKMSEKQKLNTFLQINNNKIENLLTETKVQKIVKIIEKGQCFGQMMGQDSLRATKAVARQQSEAFILEKSAYEAFFKIQMKSQNLFLYKFLCGISLFKNVSNYIIQSLSLQLKEDKMTYGQVLFRQKENINNIYIIKQGEFKLMKEVNKLPQQNINKKSSFIQYKIQSKSRKQMPYKIIEPGQVLGDSETLSFYPQYRQMCICYSQQARVLSIDKKIFFKILMQDQVNFKDINKFVRQKDKSRLKSITFFIKKNTHNPLISCILNDQLIGQRRQLQIKKKKIAVSCNRLNIQQVYNDQSLVFNEINKTIQKNINHNRFSVHKNKCLTQGVISQIRKPKKVINIPHSIKDIVQLVREKTVFQKRFRKVTKNSKGIFKINPKEVPMFIKSRYNKLQNVK